MSAPAPFSYLPYSLGALATSTDDVAPCPTIDGVVLDWSDRGTSHVDYGRSEGLPLLQGRFLGYGIHGGVYETTCKGIALAWKRKFCRQKIGRRERQEIEIIKRLNHEHIITLVGTYTQGPFLGLLLWPVAVCDLAAFIEDVDWLQRQDLLPHEVSILDTTPDDIAERTTRLMALGVWNLQIDTRLDSKEAINATLELAILYLEKSIGCMASAVAYLHRSGVKHKDLKPSNVLLSSNGIWLSDFGTATDFSLLTQSATDSGERGTPKYFAPEVAAFEPSGRAADIFSLGCIFFEMISLCIGYTLDETTRLRVKNDKSFQANLDAITHWFKFERIFSRMPADEYFLGLVRSMMTVNPIERPSAESIEDDISLFSSFTTFSGLWKTWKPSIFCGECCDLNKEAYRVPSPSLISPQMSFCMTVHIGNTYRMKFRPLKPGLHTWNFFIELSNYDLVHEVHIFKVSGNPRHRKLCGPILPYPSLHRR